MKLNKTFTIVAATLLIGVVFLYGRVGVVSADQDHNYNNNYNQGNHNPNVTFCHAKPADTAANGYKKITTDANSLINPHDNGGEHISEHDADIIPAFTYYTHQGNTYVAHQYGGKNLDNGGQEILDNNCVRPEGEQNTLSCDNIIASPALGSGNEINFGTTYTFSANITGDPIDFNWDINPASPALSSTNSSTTQWTAPSVSSPNAPWLLTLDISDDYENSSRCSLTLNDPGDQEEPTPTATPEPTPNCTGDTHLDASGKRCVSFEYGGAPSNRTDGGGEVLGASTTGSVLGATTMAKTGIVEDILSLSSIASGTILSVGSYYGYKKTQKTSKKKRS